MSIYAGVMELADVLDSKSSAFGRAGSTPATGTKNPECDSIRDFYLLLLPYSLFTNFNPLPGIFGK